MSESVVLQIDRPTESYPGPMPVTQGIPFADGILLTGTPVAVRDPGGRVLPTQVQCLATWGPDRRYVKWLLVDFQIAEPSTTGSEYILDYGDNVAGPDPPNPVTVDRDNGLVSMANGVLDLAFDPSSPTFWPRFGVVRGNDRQNLVSDSRGVHLYMQDHNLLHKISLLLEVD